MQGVAQAKKSSFLKQLTGQTHNSSVSRRRGNTPQPGDAKDTRCKRGGILEAKFFVMQNCSGVYKVWQKFKQLCNITEKKIWRNTLRAERRSSLLYLYFLIQLQENSTQQGNTVLENCESSQSYLV